MKLFVILFVFCSVYSSQILNEFRERDCLWQIYTKSKFCNLTEEIEQFTQCIKLNDDEKTIRIQAFDRLNHTISKKWPNATVEMFGSLVMGVALPNSDIDVSILGINESNVFNILKDELIKTNISASNNIFIKSNATIPVLKYIDFESRVELDVSFIEKPKFQVFNLIDSERQDLFKNLMILVKYFLNKNLLSHSTTGGLSSFCSSLLNLNFFLANQNETLPTLLTSYFDFYGNKFNYTTMGIDVNLTSKIVPRDELPCGNGTMFCVRNPSRLESNACEKTFRGTEIKRSFSEAFNILSNSTEDCKLKKLFFNFD